MNTTGRVGIRFSEFFAAMESEMVKAMQNAQQK
jgi:hypothetical protein